MARKDKRIDQLTPSTIPIVGSDLIAIYNANGTRNDNIDSLYDYISQRITGLTDTYVTGATLNSNTLEISRNGGQPTLTVDLSSLSPSGGTGSGVSYWTSGSSGNYSVKVINDTTVDATGDYAVAEGRDTLASGSYSHAEGWNTVASGDGSSHAEGNGSIASGIKGSHAEGNSTTASGAASHAEGGHTTASGTGSHAEGGYTTAAGTYSHSGGYYSTASGNTSFIHSTNSLVTGDRSVVLGGQNITGTTNDTVYVPHLEVTGQAYTPVYDNLTGGTTFTPDWDNSNVQILTLSGNTNVSGGTSTMKSGAIYTMLVKQSNGGTHIITWDSTYKWEAGSPPTLTVANGSVDIITFICDGTNLYGLIAKDFQ